MICYYCKKTIDETDEAYSLMLNENEKVYFCKWDHYCDWALPKLKEEEKKYKNELDDDD
jgi:thiol-disulfide isomerase/thioredoxin